MSEPAGFVIIRNGQKRYFEDFWARVFLFRELLWGPEAFECWLAEVAETGEWSSDCSGGAVVNFDTRELVWYCEDSLLDVPRIEVLYERLLAAAWPGFTHSIAGRGAVDLAIAAGEQIDEGDLEDDGDDGEWSDRPETVSEAVGRFDDDDDDVDDDVDETDFRNNGDDACEELDFDVEIPRAWVAILDEGGHVRHRCLELIPLDVLFGDKETYDEIVALNPVEMPPEQAVREGLWISPKQRKIGFWGGSLARRDFETLQKSWRSWTVHWAEAGYAEQCAACGLPGLPMTDSEGLAQLLPHVLSTKRFDPTAVFGAIGGRLKRGAIRAVGCLVLVLSLPILIFGYFLEAMQAAWISIGVLIVLVAVLFKVAEAKLKRQFATPPPGSEEIENTGRAPTAGPLEPNARRAQLDGLLVSCGFPTVRELEPLFPKFSSLDDIL